MKAPNKDVIDMTVLDFLHHYAAGHFRLVPFNEAMANVAKAARKLPPWWPNAVLLQNIMKKAWKDRGAVYRNIVRNAFKFKDEGSVRKGDLPEALKSGKAAGRLMWKDIEKPVGILLAETLEQGMTQFDKQHLQKADADPAVVEGYRTKWREIMAERHQDHIKVFTEKFPEHTLHPEIERLASIISKMQFNLRRLCQSLTDCGGPLRL